MANSSATRVYHYLVRVTCPNGAVSRSLLQSTQEELLDRIPHKLGDKVEFKNMGTEPATLSAPGTNTKFFNQAQVDSYLLGFALTADAPLLTCKLEDFSQYGNSVRKGDAA